MSNRGTCICTDPFRVTPSCPLALDSSHMAKPLLLHPDHALERDRSKDQLAKQDRMRRTCQAAHLKAILEDCANRCIAPLPTGAEVRFEELDKEA